MATKTVPATPISVTGAERIRVLQKTPGAFYLLDYLGVPNVELIFSCPCGCGRITKVDLKPHYIVKEATHLLLPGDAPTLDEDVTVMDGERPHLRWRLENGNWART